MANVMDEKCWTCGNPRYWCSCKPPISVTESGAQFEVKNKPMDLTSLKAVPELIASIEAKLSAPGVKYDGGKPEWHLLPWGGLTDIVKVLTYGARKYAPDNWMHVPQARTRYIDAAFRHLTAWTQGEKNDPESGLPHLAHAGCCLLFLAWFDSTTETAEPVK